MDKIKNSDHVLNTSLPYSCEREYIHNLRNHDYRNFYFFNAKQFYRTKLCTDFFTFK